MGFSRIKKIREEFPQIGDNTIAGRENSKAALEKVIRAMQVARFCQQDLLVGMEAGESPNGPWNAKIGTGIGLTEKMIEEYGEDYVALFEEEDKVDATNFLKTLENEERTKFYTEKNKNRQ